MHDLLFRFKRAHLRGVALGRVVLKEWDLTPARFDVLYVIQSAPGDGVLQSHIWEVLGLHKSTISKMVKRLEQLGLVRRSDALTREHEKRVRLTREGITRLAGAMKFVFRAQGMSDTLRALYRQAPPDADRFIATLRRAAERAARRLGDTSTLLYPLNRPSEATLEKVRARLGERFRARCTEELEAAVLAERLEKLESMPFYDYS